LSGYQQALYRPQLENISGVSASASLASLYTGDGRRYVVASDSPVQTAEAQVSGQVIVPATESSIGLIVATSITTSSDARRVSAQQLADSPDRYEYDLLAVDGSVSVAAGVAKVGLSYPGVVASVGTDVSTPMQVSPPTRFAREYVISNSREERSWPTFNLIAEQDFLTNSSLAFGQGENIYIGTAEGELVAGHTTNGTLQFREIRYDTAATVEADELDQLEQYEGDVVRISAPAAGAHISTRETLIAASNCGGEAVYVGSGCIPIPVDSVVTAGAIGPADAQGLADVVPLVGASNRLQDVPAESFTGRYEIVARVKSASALRLADGGVALQVLSLEKTGTASPADTLASFGSTIREEVSAQLRNSVSEWNSTEASTLPDATGSANQHQSPTPDSQPGSEPPPGTTAANTDTSTPWKPPEEDSGQSNLLLLLLGGVLFIGGGTGLVAGTATSLFTNRSFEVRTALALTTVFAVGALTLSAPLSFVYGDVLLSVGIAVLAVVSIYSAFFGLQYLGRLLTTEE
jgi:hypothetical protein